MHQCLLVSNKESTHHLLKQEHIYLEVFSLGYYYLLKKFRLYNTLDFYVTLQMGFPIFFRKAPSSKIKKVMAASNKIT